MKILFLSMLILIGLSSVSYGDDKKYYNCITPEKIKLIQLKDLDALDICFSNITDKEISLIKKPNRGKKLIDEVIYSMNKKAVLTSVSDYLFKNLSEDNKKNLYDLGFKSKSNFFYWLIHDEKKEIIIKSAKKIVGTNADLSYKMFVYLLKHNESFLSDKLDQEVLKIFGQDILLKMLLENIDSKYEDARRSVCRFFLEKKNSFKQTDMILKKVELKVNDNKDIDLLDCLLHHYAFVSKNYTKGFNLVDKLNWQDESIFSVRFLYFKTNSNFYSKKDFLNMLVRANKLTSFSFVESSFINHIYPGLITVPEKAIYKLEKGEECLIKFQKCITEKKLLDADFSVTFSHISKIVFTLTDDYKPYLNFVSTILNNDKVSLLNKVNLISWVSYSHLTYHSNKKRVLDEFRFNEQQKLWVHNASQISKDDYLSSNLNMYNIKDMKYAFNFKTKLANQYFHSPWFQEAVSQIETASSIKFFNNFNVWLMPLFVSDYSKDALIITNKLLLKRKAHFGIDREYVYLFWLSSQLEGLNNSDSYFSKILEGAKISKPYPDRIDLFQSLKSNYFKSQGNYKLALSEAQKIYFNNKLNLKKIEKKDRNSFYGASQRIGMCESVLNIVNINLYMGNRLDFSLLDQYCFSYYNLFLKFTPVFAQMILENEITNFLYKKINNKNKILSINTRNRIMSFLSSKDIETSLKINIYFLAGLIDESISNANKNEIKKYLNNLKTSNPAQLAFTKLKYFNGILDNKNTNPIEVNKNIFNSIIEGLEQNLSNNYISEKEENVIKTDLIMTFLINKIQRNIDKKFNPELYKIHNLLKFTQAEKIISIKKRGINNVSEARDLSRRKFLIDSLFFLNLSVEKKEVFRTELKKMDDKLIKIKKNKISVDFNSIETLQSKLSTDEVVLDFRVNIISNEIELFRIDKKSVNFYKIKDQKTIQDELIKFKQSIKRFSNKEIFEHGYFIYSKLLKPYINKNINTVYLIPNSFIYGIPFHALPLIKDIDKSYDDESVWLGLNKKIIFLSPISKKISKKSKNTFSFFGVGNPIFLEEKIVDIKNNIELGSIQTNKRGIKFSNPGFSSLPNTEEEIKYISSLPMFTKSNILIKENATEFNIKNSLDLQNADIISFATHGLVAGEMNLHSEPGLLLSSSNKNNENGYLSMSEITNLNLNAELVILSACNTGGSMNSNSSPFSGLASAFLSAGAQNVLASHWSVESKSTAELMKIILEVKSKNNIDFASAQLIGIKTFIKKFPEYKSPFYWASFVLFGTDF